MVRITSGIELSSKSISYLTPAALSTYRSIALKEGGEQFDTQTLAKKATTKRFQEILDILLSAPCLNIKMDALTDIGQPFSIHIFKREGVYIFLKTGLVIRFTQKFVKKAPPIKDLSKFENSGYFDNRKV